jgi:hypothetical protein
LTPDDILNTVGAPRESTAGDEANFGATSETMRRDITRLGETGPAAFKAAGMRPGVRASYLLGRWVQPPIYDPAREADT